MRRLGLLCKPIPGTGRAKTNWNNNYDLLLALMTLWPYKTGFSKS